MKRLAILGLVGLTVASPALAGPDVAAGQELFKLRCAACHSVGPDTESRVGPILNGVVGSVAATQADFSGYSGAMRAAGGDGLTWTPETLAKYLKKPRDFVPGTNMTFAGVAEPRDMQNVIAYLEEFSPGWQHPEVPPAAVPPPAP